MGLNFYYRANVRWANNGKSGTEIIPVYAFKGDAGQSWFIRWPDLTLEDLQLHINNVNSNHKHQFTLVTDAYLNNRAFPGKSVSMLDLFVHDTDDRPSPTEAAKVVATIRKSDMNVVNKSMVGSLARMTCERFDVAPGKNNMLLTGQYVAVTLGFTGAMTFGRA